MSGEIAYKRITIVMSKDIADSLRKVKPEAWREALHPDSPLAARLSEFGTTKITPLAQDLVGIDPQLTEQLSRTYVLTFQKPLDHEALRRFNNSEGLNELITIPSLRGLMFPPSR